MEHFIYACINLLLLAAIIFLVGRKTIVRLFRTRREKICRELDELENQPPLPADEAEPEEPASVPLPEFTPDDEAICDELRRMDAEFSQRRWNFRREALSSARSEFFEKLRDELKSIMAEEPYHSLMREKEDAIAEKIAERAYLTPGDIAYIKRSNDVLYVTLTSAYPLSEKTREMFGDKISALVAAAGGRPSYWIKVDPTLIGGFRLRIGDTIFDYTVDNMIYRAMNTLDKTPILNDDDIPKMIERIFEQIEQIPTTLDEFQLGRVISVSDGICWLDGLSDIMYGEIVEFECGERGMILDIEPARIGCIVFGQYEHLESGSRVRRVGRMASVPVGEELLGRVLDPLGVPIDGGGAIWTDKTLPIEHSAPSIPDRKSVSRSMRTGIKAIDALVPIGRGQRELIIGDRQTGKSSIAIDAIINQKGKDVICIYAAIGQKDTTVAELRSKLERYGALDYTIIVSAHASSSASMQYIAPFSATAIGEYFMNSGRDVLIVYDDLSKHAVSYRELSLLLHRPSGREAYPGDVFYLHSRLLERSAQLSDQLGGGSMTALPIIETQAGDISAYIPTNVISITDGQIFLETDLFNEGQRPAINVGLSVSRVGSAAQSALMKQVSANLRMSLAQYRELSSFSQFGSDLDDSTRKVLDAGERMLAALRQNRYAPLSDAEQSLIIYAVGNGYANGIAPAQIENFEKALLSHFSHEEPELMKLLESGAKLRDDGITALKGALEKFTAGSSL